MPSLPTTVKGQVMDHATTSPTEPSRESLEDCHAEASLAGRRLLRMPNGMEIACQTATEARFFYTDIFEKHTYCRHGVSLEGARCVFDIGANIGLFTLYAARQCPQAAVFSFEPAPPLFEILKFNCARYGTRCRLFNHGIGEGRRTAEFTFYPNSSGMSSFYGDLEEERQALCTLMTNQLADGKGGMKEVMRHADDLLQERLRSCTFRCRLLPLSDVIRNLEVSRIDLLKVDVQKSELDVIEGIDEEHWPLIRQIALEIHDTSGRLDRLSSLLRERGFEVTAEQDSQYRGSPMHHIYAVRNRPWEARKFPGSDGRHSVPGDGSCAAEDAPVRTGESAHALPWELLVFSAARPSGLDALGSSVGRYLALHEDVHLADAALKCRAGCGRFKHRLALVCRNREEAVSALTGGASGRLLSGTIPELPPQAAFLFPGLGDHSPGMAAQLYRHGSSFKAHLDRCSRILEPLLGLDMLQQLYPEDAPQSPPSGRLDFRRMARGGNGGREVGGALARTYLAQPILFALEYALARQWMAWGVEPQAMLGYSIGEYVAACLSGVLSLSDALRVVAQRARLIEGLPAGCMLAVPLGERETLPLLGEQISLAAVNGPSACVVAGPQGPIGQLEQSLNRKGLACRRLVARHAFHSGMMEPAVEGFVRLLRQVRLSKPRIPYVSNLTGNWITAAQATDPEYWAQHLCRTVRFSDGLACLLEAPGRVMLEVGPGQALTAWAHQFAAGSEGCQAIASLPHPCDGQPDLAVMLGALGKLWLTGMAVDWQSFDHQKPHHEARLPDWPVPPPAEREEPHSSAQGSSRSSSPAALAQTPYAEPRNRLETRLCAIWQELLGLKRVGIQDRFFEIGGDSLKAARLLKLLSEEFDVSVSLRRLFEASTIAALSVAVVQQQAAQVDSGLLDLALGDVQSRANGPEAPPQTDDRDEEAS